MAGKKRKYNVEHDKIYAETLEQQQIEVMQSVIDG